MYYTLTMNELEIDESESDNTDNIVIPEFRDIVEGVIDAPEIVEFDSEARTLQVQVNEGRFMNKRYFCYIVGHLNVSTQH